MNLNNLNAYGKLQDMLKKMEPEMEKNQKLYEEEIKKREERRKAYIAANPFPPRDPVRDARIAEDNEQALENSRYRRYLKKDQEMNW